VAESRLSQGVYAYGVTRESRARVKVGMQGGQLYLQITHSLRRGRSIAHRAKELANCTFASRFGLVANGDECEDGLVSSQQS